MKQEMQEKNICLFALKRSNSKENWPKSVRQLIFKLRRRVETVFSQLSGQLKCRKSVSQKAFRGYVPVWLIKYWHTISVLH
mgnify:CR=1 FL=1